MKQYQIVCRNMQWQLMIEGHDRGLLQCDERATLVQIACRVAAERGSSVQVFDRDNRLEARLSFCDGVSTTDGDCGSELDLCHEPRGRDDAADSSPEATG